MHLHTFSFVWYYFCILTYEACSGSTLHIQTTRYKTATRPFPKARNEQQLYHQSTSRNQVENNVTQLKTRWERWKQWRGSFGVMETARFKSSEAKFLMDLNKTEKKVGEKLEKIRKSRLKLTNYPNKYIKRKQRYFRCNTRTNRKVKRPRLKYQRSEMNWSQFLSPWQPKIIIWKNTKETMKILFGTSPTRPPRFVNYSSLANIC